LRIRAESDITILRIRPRHFHAKLTSWQNSIYVETLWQVNGEFNALFSWYFLPLFATTLLVETIDRLVTNQTSMQCFDGSYLNRWCELWTVCWSWKRFHFYSDTATFFKVQIAYPGSRPSPNDYLSCRIIFRMLAERAPFPRDNENLYEETSFLTCRWNGMQHFWHLLFDFTVPLWWAMRLHNRTDRSARIFTLDNNTGQKGYLFCDAMSPFKVENIRNMTRDKLSCWRHAIIGVPKAKRNVRPEKWPNGYDMPYEYPHESVIRLRDHFLLFHNATQCEPDPSHPRVVLTLRHSEKRHIENKLELVNKMKEWCPECEVVSHYPRNETLQTPLGFVCNASLLIGIHGSGLSHMLFQKPATREAPTAAIEILPYRYICRNWYRFAAITANVRYFHWINPFLNKTRPARGSIRSPCFTGESECLSDQCHDLL
jgi:hypothetical protein